MSSSHVDHSPVRDRDQMPDEEEFLERQHQLDHILRNLHSKSVLTILHSRVPLSPALSRSGERRVNRWFNIELDESEEYKDDIRVWKMLDFKDHCPPLVLEIFLAMDAPSHSRERLVIIDENGKSWDVASALSSDDTGKRHMHDSSEVFLVCLEQWTLTLGDLDGALPRNLTDTLPRVYKSAIVFFRSLFTYCHILPALGVSRSPGLRLAYRIRAGPAPTADYYDANLFPRLYDDSDQTVASHSFDTDTPAGLFSVEVKYRKNCDFRINSSKEVLSAHFSSAASESSPIFSSRDTVDEHLEGSIHLAPGNLSTIQPSGVAVRPRSALEATQGLKARRSLPSESIRPAIHTRSSSQGSHAPCQPESTRRQPSFQIRPFKASDLAAGAPPDSSRYISSFGHQRAQLSNFHPFGAPKLSTPLVRSENDSTSQISRALKAAHERLFPTENSAAEASAAESDQRDEEYARSTRVSRAHSNRGRQTFLYSHSPGGHVRSRAQSVASAQSSLNSAMRGDDRFETDYQKCRPQKPGSGSHSSYHIDQPEPRFPPLPTFQTSSFKYICDICGCELKILRKRDWQRHVLEDLEPYVCLEPKCPASSASFSSDTALLQHYQQIHSDSKLCASKKVECQFCEDELPGSTSLRFRHLARHLEEIAFTVIPQVNESWTFYSNDGSICDVPVSNICSPESLGRRLLPQKRPSFRDIVEAHPQWKANQRLLKSADEDEAIATSDEEGEDEAIATSDEGRGIQWSRPYSA